MSKFPEGAISTEGKGTCDCCEKPKKVAMYVTQMGTTAWICKECRNGETKRDK